MELEGVQGDLAKAHAERKEAVAKLSLLEDKHVRVKAEFDAGYERWAVERRELEQRLAASEASKEAARASEKRIMVRFRVKLTNE